MANTQVATKSAPSLSDVRDAIKSGAFSMEDLMNAIADQKQYVRAGGFYRELIKDGVSVVNGQFAMCYKLGAKIDNEGKDAPVKPRKKKSE